METEDGYELTVFRIQEKNLNLQPGKPVVLMMHGFLDCSDTFIVNDESLSPAFYFANLGYDVWLGNNRGNTYARSHKVYDPDQDKEFWDFSFQDMAMYDLPALFQFIQNRTQMPKIHYIGHSQGSIQMFAALSLQIPIICNTLGSAVFFGPVVYLKHSQGLFEVFYKTVRLYSLVVFQDHLDEEIMPRTWFINEVASRVCVYLPYICKFLIGSISSKSNIDLDNEDRFETIIGHEPAGSSMKNAQHLLQIYKSGRFEQFDYGKIGNQVHYAQEEPMQYDLAQVRFEDMFFVVGTEDPISTMEDVATLKNELTYVKNIEVYQFEGGHLSYMWGKSMPHLARVAAYLERRTSLQKN